LLWSLSYLYPLGNGLEIYRLLNYCIIVWILLEDKNPGMLNEGKYSTNEKLRSTLTICYSASKLSNFMKFMAKDTAVQHTAIFEAKKKSY
jgi:hypothetical protein